MNNFEEGLIPPRKFRVARPYFRFFSGKKFLPGNQVRLKLQ